MNPKKQLSLIIFSTVLSAFSLASIINFTDPLTAGLVTLSFFYASLFLFCLGLITLLGLVLRNWLKLNLYVVNLGNSFRQAFIISIFIVASFILLAGHLLFWWVELSLILFFLSIEIFFNLKI